MKESARLMTIKDHADIEREEMRSLSELDDDEQDILRLYRKAKAYRKQADEFLRHQNEADRLSCLAATDLETLIREMVQ